MMALTTTLDFGHAKVHAGRVFEVGATASGTGYCTLLFSISSGYDAHVMVDGYSSAATTFRIWENAANAISSGSAATPVNRNRCVPEKRGSKATVRSGVTPNSSGATALTPIIFVGAGVGPQAVGGTHGSRDERVLEGGKKYLFTLGNASANKNLILNWYEVPSQLV